MDILHYLKTQHESIREMCQQVTDAKALRDRKSHLENLVRTTQVYLTLQRDFLYPELSGLFPASDELIATSRINAKAVDKAIKSLVNLVSQQAFDTTSFVTKMNGLADSLEAHFTQDEQHLLPQMRQHIRTEEREDLGLVFTDAETEVVAGIDERDPRLHSRRKRA